MSSASLVSICMPIYNQGEFVTASVASILNQTHREFELIIVDDGSTDHTPEMIAEFSDSRIRYVRNEVNRGNLACRNDAFGLAGGDYVALMDSDDICAPERLELQVEALDAGYDICGSWATASISPVLPTDMWRMPRGRGALESYCLVSSPLPNPSVMLTREYQQRADYVFSEDWFPAADYHALAVHILLKGARAWAIPRPLVFRRMNARSISAVKRDLQKKKADEIRALLLRGIGVDDQSMIDEHNRFVAGELTAAEREDFLPFYREVLPGLRPDVFRPSSFTVNGTRLACSSAPEPAPPRGDDAPEVSVVVPAYNIEAYLKDCAVSVLGFNDAPIELIIVDDGSTDGTANVARDLAAAYPGAVRVVSQENQGLSAARNSGVAAAKGVFVCFLDGDDLLRPGAIDLLLRRARETDAEVVVGAHAAFDEDSGEETPRLTVTSPRIFEDDAVFVAFADRVFGHVAWNKLIRRDLALETPFLRGLYHEDELFCPELFLKAGRVATVTETTYLYRQRTGSITSSTTNKHIADWLEILRRVDALCRRYGKIQGVSPGYSDLMGFLGMAARNKLARVEDLDPDLERRAHREIGAFEAHYLRYGALSGNADRQAKMRERQDELELIIAALDSTMQGEDARLETGGSEPENRRLFDRLFRGGRQ